MLNNRVNDMNVLYNNYEHVANVTLNFVIILTLPVE